ncbi:MAG: ExeM/NucH family extracellular endonuclease, partial [Actinomycetota bacterium]
DGVDTDTAADWFILDFGNDPAVNTPTAATAFEPPAPAAAIVINEVLGSTTSTDSEFIELFGTPGTSLDGLSVLIVESDEGSSNGTIDRQIDLTGALGGNGFFLLANGLTEAEYGVTADQSIADNTIENSSYTVALVETASITGSTVSGSEVVLDTVAVTDGGAADSFFFDAPVIGPDGSFLPAGVGRITDGVDTDTAADWELLDFNLASPPNSPTAGGGDVEPPDFECGVNDLTLISSVQGAGAVSPLEGSTVTVRGVVTLVAPELNGFFVQEEDADADADPSTSEGVFVFGDGSGLAEDMTVEVVGEVSEFFSSTQIGADASADCAVDGSGLVTPTGITLPLGDTGREALEGMVVTTTQDLSVTSLFAPYRFGELGVTAGDPLTQPTSAFAPSDPAAQALADANAENFLKLDDRGEFGNSALPWAPDPATPLRAGDTLPAGATGPLAFSFGEYKIQPIGAFPEIVPSIFPRPEAPTLADGNDIAAFNVLNYFTTFGSRGAANQAEFDLQAAKIVEAITELDAAVLGLIEIENNYESQIPAIVDLVDRLNAASGAGTWDWVRSPGGTNIGPDEIAVGMIYQPAKATLIGDGATFDIDAGLTGEDTTNNRWPLAATFEIADERFTVVVNHFKSKGSTCTDTAAPGYFELGEDVGTDLTGNCDLTRQYAADQLLQWLDTDPTASGDSDVFIVGDLNAYEEEGPIAVLEAAGYVDLIEVKGNDKSTYKFDGRYGRLDYLMASSSAVRIVADADVWQANSPEFYGNLYDNAPTETVETATAYASSDHDPVVLSIRDVVVNEPPNIFACFFGGWKGYTKADGSDFRNFRDCLRYVFFRDFISRW